MLPVLYAAVFAIALLLPALLLGFLLRRLHPAWWRRRAVRICARAFCVIAPLSVLTPLLPYGADRLDLVAGGCYTILIVVLWEAALLLLIPFTAVLRYAFTHNRGRIAADAPDLSRRRFLHTGLAALPVGAMALSGGGVLGSALRARVFEMEARIAQLPPELEGLRILQISDLHLGLFVTLRDLESILERARALAPELVLVTGDLMDDLRVMPAALDMIRDFGAPLGAYACLGNHEHAIGLNGALHNYEGHAVRLLNNTATTVARNGRAFTLAGIDDFDGAPRYEDEGRFYRRALGEALAGASDRFRVLMSHRPRAFNLAPDFDVDLTLSGHTHGGQLGFLGRSHKAWRHTHPYPWGFYRRGRSLLYTTSGAGQWIPFRLGCPAEAPVIVLTAG